MVWSTWRMYKARIGSIGPVTYSTGRYWDGRVVHIDDYRPTRITFRARNQLEAIRKGDKFWREAEIGMGSFVMIEEA